MMRARMTNYVSTPMQMLAVVTSEIGTGDFHHHSRWRSCARSLAFTLLCCSTLSIRAQSNIVYNGNFDNLSPHLLAGWSVNDGIGASVNLDRGAASVTLGWSLDPAVPGRLWQDLNTVAGRTYLIRFAAG